MFCATCNLEYPDHLNFCRSCGQTLVRAPGERATESVCCTRCGARVVHGEKFCQHCGTKAGVVTQETVIGLCRNCNKYWKNSWLFCKSCGVDREQALQWNTATSSQQAAVSLKNELADTQSQCEYCTAPTQAFSMFCENCGMRLTKEKEENAVAVKSVTNPEAPIPASGKKEPASAKKEEDELSRLDDLLLDDPLQLPNLPDLAQPSTGDKLQDVGNLPKSAKLPSLSQPLPVAVMATAEPERAAPALRLVERERQTQNLSASSASLDKAPALPAVGRSWREAVALPSGVDDGSKEQDARPLEPNSRDRNIALLLDEHASSQRPLWHVPLVLGGVLLATFLIYGVWRKSQVPRVLNQAEKIAADVKQPTTAPSTVAITAPAGMVYIPGGKFEMGRADGAPEEQPIRTLEIKPFYLDRTEVTNQQYLVFVEASGHRAPGHWPGGKPMAADANLPVVNVTWQDATDFATWAGRRLPTEEEWEFAARGTDGRLYPWGKNWEPAFANTAEGKAGKIVEVGRYLGGASPYGVVDLCGNVWEWTSSQLRAYGTQELLEDGVMVIRGGAFDSPKEFATMSYRGAVRIDKPYPKTGFRCARDFP